MNNIYKLLELSISDSLGGNKVVKLSVKNRNKEDFCFYDADKIIKYLDLLKGKIKRMQIYCDIHYKLNETECNRCFHYKENICSEGLIPCDSLGCVCDSFNILPFKK